MATPRKTAAKPAAKKPVTRTRKVPTKNTAGETVSEATLTITDNDVPHQPMPLSPDEKQAQLDAYAALKRANLSVPKELADRVQNWIQEEESRRKVEEALFMKEQEQVAEINDTGPWYVLNNYGGTFSLRLERQDKKKRIELKPLGHRGDMHPLQEGDLGDPILQANLELGLVSLIPAGEAAKRSKNQVHNVRQPHTPLAILRNERGEQYAQGSVKVEAEFNSQGVTVAYLDPEVAQGRKAVPKQSPMGDLVRDRGAGNPYAQTQVGPGPVQQVSHFVPTGGNPAIISSGFAGDQKHAKIADDIARRKGTEGPSAGLPEGITVSVDPVQRT